MKFLGTTLSKGVMKRTVQITGSAIAVAVFTSLAIAYYTMPPTGFPSGTVVDIRQGMTMNEVADLLSSKGLIKSRTLFKAYATLLDGTTGVKQGEYAFYSPQSSLGVAYRLDRGLEGFPLAKVTIPEGADAAETASIISRAIPGFDAKGFMTLAKPQEGYLFPDTYFWPTNLTPQKAISDMRSVFDGKIAAISGDIASSGKSESDVIKMASIVEKEAASTTDRRIIAGILWKRLDQGMPLQVDPTLIYITGKPWSQLTVYDLATTSPYNSYKYKGLPPTPIDSPGLDAIRDTLHPTQTPYLYYLSDKSGVIHYASTLAGHVANKQKYLD
ncbi:MAG: endolytic transglycosylase MltG [Patescibacteria group bacterium]|nr:endolytic transglycosylase MltG [Patescibacteria group bacterium]